MIDLTNVEHIYIACGYTDLRKGIDGYIYLVDSNLKINPFDNAIFLFCNKSKNKIKILHHERGSFWLYYKRIEQIKIKWPLNMIGIEIKKSDVRTLLSGMKLTKMVKKW